MKSIKNYLTLIAIMLFSLPTMAQEMSEDEAIECIKTYIDSQKSGFGTFDETLHVTLANIQVDGNRVKVVFNKEDGEFTPLFPELTEGKFKTDAQENRYVNRQYGLYVLAHEVHNNPKFLEALEKSKFKWDVFIMDSHQNVPYYTFTFSFQNILNSINLNNGDVASDFKTFLSTSLVDRALKSLMEKVYIPHDSIGISYAHMSSNMVNCTMLAATDAFHKLTATNGMVARNEWIESFLEDCMSKNYYKQLLEVIKTTKPTVYIRVEDVHKKLAPQTFTVNTFDIIAAAEKSSTGGLSAADYIAQQIDGNKQNSRNQGFFMAKYGDVASQVKQVVSETLTDNSRRIYDVVDEMPEFPGGSIALANYLHTQVKYPPLAEQNKIQGRVTCQFVITNEGVVTNVKVSRSSDPLLDAEAKRVISEMPKWIPGRHHGERVNTKYSVPITFTLPN